MPLRRRDRGLVEDSAPAASSTLLPFPAPGGPTPTGVGRRHRADDGAARPGSRCPRLHGSTTTVAARLEASARARSRPSGSSMKTDRPTQRTECPSLVPAFLNQEVLRVLRTARAGDRATASELRIRRSRRSTICRISSFSARETMTSSMAGKGESLKTFLSSPMTWFFHVVVGHTVLVADREAQRRVARDLRSSDVRGHDDHRVPEVHHSALDDRSAAHPLGSARRMLNTSGWAFSISSSSSTE